MPGLARGTTWLGTTMPAFANEQPSSRSAAPRSTTTTQWPYSAHISATHRPTTPPPMTTTLLTTP
jgi:hypothetical protein